MDQIVAVVFFFVCVWPLSLRINEMYAGGEGI